MGSDSTIPRSGRQGPPLPDTDLAQAAGPDPKIGNLSWARGSEPGPGAVIEPGQEPYELPGLGEGDGEAERLDLPDVVTELTVGVGTGLVVADSEVGVPGCGIGEQVLFSRSEARQRYPEAPERHSDTVALLNGRGLDLGRGGR